MKRHPILMVFALLLAVVLGAGYWLLHTESGLRWVWARAAPALEGVVAVDELRGTLAGPLRAEGLVVATPGATVHAPWLEVEWTPSALLWGTVRFVRLVTGPVVVALEPADGIPEEGPFRFPELPLALSIVEGRMEGLRIRQAGEFVAEFNEVALSGHLRGSRLDVDHFRLSGEGLTLAIAGEAGLRQGGPLDLQLDYSVAVPDAPPIAGHGTIGGTFDRPRVNQRLTAPAATRLEAELAWFDRPFGWRAQLETEPLRLSDLGDLPSTEVALRLHGEGDVERLSLTGDADIRDTEMGPWKAEFQGRLDGEAWQIERLLLASTEGPARFRGTATGHGLTPDRFDAERILLVWEQLQWPLAGEGAVWRSPAGELRAGGRPDAYSAEAELTVTGPELPEGHWRLRGTGDKAGFTIAVLEGDWLDGTISGDGRVTWAPLLSWQAGLSLKQLDPGSAWPRWPGRLDGRVASRGRIIDSAAELDLSVERLGGMLRGYPVAGNAQVAVVGERLRIDTLELASGQARLQAKGELGAEWALTAELSAPRLEHLHPDLLGSLDATAQLAGRRDAPRIDLNAHGERLVAAGRRLRELSLRADLDAAAERWEAELNVTGLEAAPFPPVETLQLTSTGALSEHTVRLVAEGGAGELELAGTGGWTGELWRGEVSEGRLDGAAPGEWRQLAPAELVIGADRVRLSEWCWGADTARVCAGAQPEKDATRAALEVERLPLELLAPLITEEAELAGELDGAAALLYADTPLELAARITARDGRLGYPAPDGQRHTLAFTLDAEAESRAHDLLARFDLRTETGGYARGSIRLPDWLLAPTAPPQIIGEIELEVEQLGWLAPFLPQVSDPQGRLSGKVGVEGRLPRPALSGRLALEEGGAVVPELGVSLEAGELVLVADGAGPVEVRGSVRSGPGQVAVAGTVHADSAADSWQIDLRVEGENVEVVRLPQARVLASPALDLAVQPGAVRVTGTVAVPEAEVLIPELPEGVQPSPDVVIVGRRDAEAPAAEAAPGWALAAEVTVQLGERVRVTGYGFEGRLEGALTVIERPGQLPVGRGDLRIVDGRYAAYGQELEITDGRLLFAATPLDNPQVDFRAVRAVGEVTVGVTVTGRAREPLLRLFSEPPMEESDILSYLILGRPLRAASSDDAGLLSQAALSLGLAGGERIAQSIAGRFGLDLVEVETGNGADDAALVLGKYLSPRLYVEYAVGLLTETNAWLIRYELTERLTVEAETGGTTGGVDLFYTFER